MIKIKVKHRDIDKNEPFKTISILGRLNPYNLGIYHGLLIKGELIQAIKILKDNSGLGLKECKDLQDWFRRECWFKGIPIDPKFDSHRAQEYSHLKF